MRIEGNTVVLERKKCGFCHEGTTPKLKWKECPKCKGTGRRGGGRCRNCVRTDMWRLSDPGRVSYYDHDDREVCSECHGNWENFLPENWTDYLDISSIQVTVELSPNREMNWAEQHLGSYGLGSVVDYGRWKNQTVDQLIAEVRKGFSKVQATKVVRSKEDLTICDELVVVTADQGYTVVPRWREDG